MGKGNEIDVRDDMLYQSHAEYAAPLLPSGLWQPDIEQSVGTVPALASWFNDFFSMLPR